MQVIDGVLEEMSGSELLDHVDLLEENRRGIEVQILRAAVQHAILHNPDTLDPEVSKLNGRERAVRFGGDGTPQVAEFAGAAFGARLRVSDYAGRAWIADGLDLLHRFPQLWERVQARQVKVSYARHVVQKTRDLTLEQALYVDGRVAESADGRIPWTRFETLVQAAVKAADPVAASEREQAAAREQFAKPTRSTEHGMRSFWIRGPFATIASFDAMVAFVAQVLADLGDQDFLDARRVKAVLVLANPVQAVELLTAYAGWRDRPADPPMPPEDTAPEDNAPDDIAAEDTAAEDTATAPDVTADTAAPEDTAAPTDSADSAAASSGDQAPRTGDKPTIDWSKLLPAVVLFVHTYGERDSERIARVEGMGPVTEDWVRRLLGPGARFTIRPVLDLAGQAPVDSYEIPDRHRQAVHLMTPADIFPFSSNLSRKKQVDHTVRFVHGPAARGAGQSRVGNYGPMTTFHHRIKTHGTWQVKQPFPGIYVWRDEHGAFFLVDHTGTRRTTATERPPSRLEAYTADFLLAA